MRLSDLGLDDWFRERWKESQPSDLRLARVTAVHKNRFILRNETAEIPAELTGKLLFGSQSNLDLPVVGDWVKVSYFNDNTLAVVHGILERKSLLKRKAAGIKIEYQAIASNIDTAFIVQSAESDFNLRRLERYLTIVNDARIEPALLLSKTDLLSPERLSREISEVRHLNPGFQIFPLSNKTGEGLEAVQDHLRPGHTYCLLGTSGVGKTTLINRLIGKNVYATGTVRSKDGSGRHITASRQLILLDSGAMIIDTPGMRELGTIGVETGLDETFDEIARLARNCRFKDCTHTNEHGCSVTEAVKTGQLSEKRYQNYLKIKKESEYHEMSYLERRKKDRAFGKMVKSFVKEKKRQKIDG